MTARLQLRHPAVLLACLSLVITAPGLVNGFVYDDVAAIVQNPILHSLRNSPRIWVSSYWATGLLYRPVTIQLFALEWWLGGGAPWIFHAVNVALMAIVTVLVFRVAGRILPAPGALAAGALFAIHPVHTEVVANAVGQSELLAALFTLIAVDRYLTWRAEGRLGARRRAALALLYLFAIASKETGYVLPGLLLAVELLVVQGGRARRERVRQTHPVFAMLLCTAVIALLVRSILFGSLKAETASVALSGAGFPERAVTMLGAIPQWFRLLLWPAHLQANYGPPELPVGTALRVPSVLGLALLAATAALLAGTWRRAPAAALGIAWIGIALAPVTNLVTATGILLAERTLFLPSVGFVLTVGWCVAMLAERLHYAARFRNMAFALGAGYVVLLAAGAFRTFERASAWRTQESFFRSLERDAAGTYRAHFSAAGWYLAQDSLSSAARAFHSAITLYQADPRVYEEYGQLYRRQKHCDRALPIFREGLTHNPGASVLRARLVECSLAVGDTAAARALAREAVERGQTEFEGTVNRISP